MDSVSARDVVDDGRSVDGDKEEEEEEECTK